MKFLYNMINCHMMPKFYSFDFICMKKSSENMYNFNKWKLDTPETIPLTTHAMSMYLNYNTTLDEVIKR